MNYLFDTNILVHYLRKSSVKAYVEATFDPSNQQNTPATSVVSVGEIHSLAIQNNWGMNRLRELDNFLEEFLIADINSEDVIRQ